jgi:hypothetical protein
MNMDAKTALETKLRPKLEESFGTAMTTTVINSQAQRLGINLSFLTEDQFAKLAEALAEDQRVLEMWGQAKAKFQALAWKGALRL